MEVVVPGFVWEYALAGVVRDGVVKLMSEVRREGVGREEARSSGSYWLA